MDLKYLNDQGIIWRTTESFPDNNVYNYYPEGKDSYRLFGYNYQITSLPHLMYHFVVIRVLNEDIDLAKFERACRYINNSSKTTNDEEMIDSMIEDAWEPSDVPKPTRRKFFFNPKYKLNQSERMTIINNINQKPTITEDDIFDAIGSLQKSGVKVNASRIAAYLDVSRKTLYKHMSQVLKEMIKELKTNK